MSSSYLAISILTKFKLPEKQEYFYHIFLNNHWKNIYLEQTFTTEEET